MSKSGLTAALQHPIEDEAVALRRRVAQLEAQLQEQRHTIATLKERETRYRQTFDHAAVGIAHVSLRGRFTYVNKRVCEILGYTREEMTGLTFFQLTHPDDSPQTKTNHDHLTHAHVANISVEKRYLHKNGHAVWVHLVSTLVHDTETGERYYLSVLDDISTRKRADEFKKAMEAAQSASRAKGQFLANMSHEIRTPISGILAMTEFVLDTALTDEQRESLYTVKTSTHALLEIVNSILDLSKIEVGKIELERVEFEPREMLGDTLKPLELQAKAKDLELHWKVATDVPERLHGDRGRLRQILLNLVGNALKFTQHGSVRLRVETESLGPEEVTLHISVTDTGIGISPERLQKIFAPFEQADGSTSRNYGGTGLGLTISSRLVELMGGRLDVRSEPEAGSTFWFTATFGHSASYVAPPTPPRPQRELAATARPAPPSAPEEPRRILLVEDHDINRMATYRILRRRGFEVQTAENGELALEALEHTHFDVVLMDVQMPRMDGLTATRVLRMREQGTERHTVVVGLTARAMDGDADACVAAGMDAYLSKPYPLQDLYDAIERAYGGGSPSSDNEH